MRLHPILIILILFFLTSCSTADTIYIYQQGQNINDSLEYISFETDNNILAIEFHLEYTEPVENFADLLEIDIINIKCDDIGYEYGGSTSSRQLLLGTNYNIYVNDIIVDDTDDIELIEEQSYNIIFEFVFLDLEGDIVFEYAYFFLESSHFGVSG